MNKKFLKIFGIIEIIMGVLAVILFTIADSEQFVPSLVVLAILLVLGLTNLWTSLNEINKTINVGSIIELIGICSGVIIVLLSPILNKGAMFFPPSLVYLILISFPLILIGFIIRLIGRFIRK